MQSLFNASMKARFYAVLKFLGIENRYKKSIESPDTKTKNPACERGFWW